MLQEFNPMPFAAMILNHTGWVVYAVLHTDWFIFSAETTGLLCGIWITFSLYPLSNEKVGFAGAIGMRMFHWFQ